MAMLNEVSTEVLGEPALPATRVWHLVAAGVSNTNHRIRYPLEKSCPRSEQCDCWLPQSCFTSCRIATQATGAVEGSARAVPPLLALGLCSAVPLGASSCAKHRPCAAPLQSSAKQHGFNCNCSSVASSFCPGPPNLSQTCRALQRRLAAGPRGQGRKAELGGPGRKHSLEPRGAGWHRAVYPGASSQPGTATTGACSPQTPLAPPHTVPSARLLGARCGWDDTGAVLGSVPPRPPGRTTPLQPLAPGPPQFPHFPILEPPRRLRARGFPGTPSGLAQGPAPAMARAEAFDRGA